MRFPPVAYALRHAFSNGYNTKDFFADLSAGFVVSLIALPLSMALAIAVGLPPEHGIYTAIAAGFITALLGGSMSQVSGPTAAFVVILAPIVANYGLRGLIIAELMAGVWIILMSIFRLGRLILYIPYPVTTGFTAGIAVVLAFLSLNDFLGLGISNLTGHFHQKIYTLFTHFPSLYWPSALVGGLTLLILASWPRRLKIPSTIVAVVAASALTYVMNHHGFHIPTIGSVFSSVDQTGVMKSGIPSHFPQLHFFTVEKGQLFSLPSLEEITRLLPSSLVIALLAALESLLSATVADSMSGTRHHPDGELFGIGAANLCSAFVAGIPATGAIARTATNIKNGARSPIASMSHALFILLYVLCLAPLLATIPMSSLAAILIMTAWHMSHAKHSIHLLRTAHWTENAVFLACFVLTVFIDMVAGVSAGIILALVLFIRRMIETTHVTLVTDVTMEKEHIPTLPKGVWVYHIHGPLFFGTAGNALELTELDPTSVHSLIISIEDVPVIDMTAMVLLEQFIESHQKRGITMLLCANHHITPHLRKRLPGSIPVFSSLDTAISYAQERPS